MASVDKRNAALSFYTPFSPLHVLFCKNESLKIPIVAEYVEMYIAAMSWMYKLFVKKFDIQDSREQVWP